MIPSADHSSDHYPGIEMTIAPFFPSLSVLGCCLTLPPLMLTLPLSHSTPLLCYFGPIINDLLSSPIIATAVRGKGRRRRTTGGVIRPFQIGSISQRTLPPRRLLLPPGRPVRLNAEDRSARPIQRLFKLVERPPNDFGGNSGWLPLSSMSSMPTKGKGSAARVCDAGVGICGAAGAPLRVHANLQAPRPRLPNTKQEWREHDKSTCFPGFSDVTKACA